MGDGYEVSAENCGDGGDICRRQPAGPSASGDAGVGGGAGGAAVSDRHGDSVCGEPQAAGQAAENLRGRMRAAGIVFGVGGGFGGV